MYGESVREFLSHIQIEILTMKQSKICINFPKKIQRKFESDIRISIGDGALQQYIYSFSWLLNFGYLQEMNAFDNGTKSKYL